MLTVLGVILLVFALFLIVSVLMQHGKAKNISGAIAGGAETFFGKEKGSTINNKLSKLTTVVAIVFALLVLVSYFLQDTVDLSSYTAAASGSDDLTATITEALGDTVVDGAAEEVPAEEPAAEGEVTEP